MLHARLFAFAALIAGSAHAQVTTRTLTLSGDPAPGQPAGVTFSAFDAVANNASGQITLFATVAGPGVTPSNRQGIWWTVPGSLQAVMRLADPAPGQGGLLYSSATSANLSDNGTLVYATTLTGSVDSAWTVTPGNSPAVLFRDGTQVPGAPAGVLWDASGLPSINESGVMAFRGLLRGAGVTTESANAHIVGPAGGLTVGLRGDDPTGILPGVNFVGVFNDFAINSAGTMLSRTGLAGAGVTTENNQAVWTRSAGGTRALIVRTGEQAPGFAAGVVHTGITGTPALDRSGRIGFVTSIAGPGVASGATAVAWIHENGVTTKLVQSGDQAPGLAAGLLLDGSFRIIFGGQNTLTLTARIRGAGVTSANRSVLYKRTGDGPLTLVARGGNPAPGTTSTFEDISGNGNIAMNANGRIMLAAPLANGRDGLWLEDATGSLQLVLLENTAFDVDDGPGVTLRTISSLGFPPNAGDDDGRFSGFSDNGEVVYRLTFTNATAGVFISRLPQGCDSIDFNQNSVFPEDQDVIDFFSVLAGATCATCADIDFNNNGVFPEDQDVVDFFNVLAGGVCS